MAALAGMIVLPSALVLLPPPARSHLTTETWVPDALRGMGMVSAGLILATGVKLLPTLRTHPLGRPLAVALAALGFAAVVLLHWPLVAVIGDARAHRRCTGMAAAAGLEYAWRLADLLLHFLALSLLAIGGAITTVPEMHRYLVSQRGWLAEADFTSAIALAQAEGPNLLFVVVLGYQVAGWRARQRPWPACCCPPPADLAATRWARANREWRGVRFQCRHDAADPGADPVVWLLLAAFLWAPSTAGTARALMVLTIDADAAAQSTWVAGARGGDALGP